MIGTCRPKNGEKTDEEGGWGNPTPEGGNKMLQIKVLVVKGQLLNRGGVRVSTLAESIEAEVNKAIKGIENDVVDIQTETDFGTLATGGSALILIKFQGSDDKKKK